MTRAVILFLLLFGYSFGSKAQNRFYAGVQAGPKLSFSNTTLFDQSMAALEINQSAPGKLKYQLGTIFGYNFLNPRLSLETGFSIHQHAMIAQFRKRDDYPTPPELKFSYATEQIPLILKTVLSNPESKIRIKLSLGGAWVFSGTEVAFEDNSIYDTRRKNELYTFPYAENNPENFAFGPNAILYGFTVKENWLLLCGLEGEMRLSSRFNLNIGITYQTSIRPVHAFGFEYNYNFQRNANQNGGVYYEPMEYGTLQSKAEAINLNIGLTYSFCKRNKN